MGAELFRADGQTDGWTERHDEAGNRFLQFCERAQNHMLQKNCAYFSLDCVVSVYMSVCHYLLKSVATCISLNFPLISVQVCRHWKLVKRMYPLHDQEALEKLGKKWYWSLFGKQPLGESPSLCAMSVMKLKMLLKWELYIRSITATQVVLSSAPVGCRYTHCDP